MTALLKHDSRSSHIAVTIPLPPSVNRLYIRSRSGVTCTPEYKRWKHDAGWTLKAARIKPLQCDKYCFEMSVARLMRGDCDNRAKACIDLFVSLGLVPDDKHAAHVSVWRSPEVAPGSCKVLIYPFVSLFEAQSAEAG